jgi:hypothetical protein
MPLPRSVVEESRDSFVARRVESKMFRGFSFIQKDFLLPNRNNDEIEKYWNSVDEEGESESECASSKVGSDDAPQPVPVELEKKRKPRKRKKKDKVAGVAASMSVASTDMQSAFSVLSVLSVDGDDASARSAVKAVDAAKQTAITANVSNQSPKPILPKESPQHAKPNPQDAKVTVKQVPLTSTSPITPTPAQQEVQSRQSSPQGKAANSQPLKQPPPLQQQPWAQPYSLDTTRNQKYAPPQRRGVAPIHGTSEDGRPQHQHYPQQPMHPKAGWAVAHPHPQAAGGRASQTTPTRPIQQSHSPPAVNPVTQPLTRGPPPGSWAAKISAPKAPQPRAQPTPKPAQPPPPPSPVISRQATDIIPPAPSSDWRDHHMLKSPTKKMNGGDDWPGLDDFPAPPAMGQPKAAIKTVKPSLQGAWATKK